MRILIVEDEIRIAKLLERIIREIWQDKLSRIHHCKHLGEANNFLLKYPIDLLFLDLNLNGQDGFKLLQQYTAQSFHTVVVSAYRNKAIEAFEYGVLDFVPKPFNKERLQKTYHRIIGKKETSTSELKFVAIKKGKAITLIPIKDLIYAKAEGHYSYLFLNQNKKELSDHSLEKLELLLPNTFVRIHRSYIVNLDFCRNIRRHPGSKYEVELSSGTLLPIGRSRLKELQAKMI